MHVARNKPGFDGCAATPRRVEGGRDTLVSPGRCRNVDESSFSAFGRAGYTWAYSQSSFLEDPMSLADEMKHLLHLDKDKPSDDGTEPPAIGGDAAAESVARLPEQSGSPAAALQTATDRKKVV